MMSIEEFKSQIAYALSNHIPHGQLEIDEMNPVRFKARYHVEASLFIDIFYAIRTGKISFAVIQKGERVFGVDNLGGWHCHPFGKPKDHKPIAKPLIEEIIGQCTTAIERLRGEASKLSKGFMAT